MIADQQQQQHFSSDQPPPAVRRPKRATSSKSGRAKKQARLLACVDDTPDAEAVAAHSLAIARSLGLEVTLARVIEEAAHTRVPADPIEWQLRCQAQREKLQDLEHRMIGSNRASSVVLVGDPSQELIDWGEANGAAVLAMTTHGGSTSHGLGSTALRILDSGATSLLLVPPDADPGICRYRRILVPLDGSARAESVLPIAKRIARTHQAELLLVHVVHQPPVPSGFRPDDLAGLRAEIERQNEQGARTHLQNLRLRVLEDGLSVRSRLLGPADPRHALCQLTRDEGIDLVVFSSHGSTALHDVPCGSVAEYLATHCTMPVLMVRPNLAPGNGPGRFDTNGQSVFRFG